VLVQLLLLLRMGWLPMRWMVIVMDPPFSATILSVIMEEGGGSRTSTPRSEEAHADGA